MSHAIELKKVSKYYAGESGVSMGFARVDLSLDMGEFVAITGESGSGKSTLLNVISGLDNYDEGELFVFGEDTSGFQTEDYERYRKTYIGNIFQDFNLVNSYTVYQNIELVMLLSGRKASECKERITELIELVGLTEYTKTKASKLSGGQKQRVAIARALAKDAPIIVADEPTGNLDSESANIVMETLNRISREKLVVIVTHNYEQAEPYVTRKLTMHDGRLIEDKMISKSVAADQEDEAGEPLDADMGLGGELKLGFRNTFNLPAKFILLFLVYLFVSTSMFSQYTSTKNGLHSRDILGYNQNFSDTCAERVIVSKKDKSVFTADEMAAIAKMDNVDKVAGNDITIDRQCLYEFGDFTMDGRIYPLSFVDQTMLTYGKMPTAANEIVVYVDSLAMNYSTIKDAGESIIGKTCTVKDYSNGDFAATGTTFVISGVIIDGESAEVNITGSSKVYMDSAEASKIAATMLATTSKTTINYNGNKIESSGLQMAIPNANVPAGKAYISETQAINFNTDENVEGKYLGIAVSNTYYNDLLELKVGKVFTEKTVTANLGYAKSDYNKCLNFIFINPDDYYRLYNKGDYQLSIYMKNETASEKTTAALDAAGYKYLLIKDSLTDITGGFNFVLKLMSIGLLIFEFVIMYFIAYAVIKLIMKSRNTYYSTLRILGASKKNTDRVLKIELLTQMTLAFVINVVFALLVLGDKVKIGTLKSQYMFLTPFDCVIFFCIMTVMSLMIANRYSKKIFSKSAMTAYREEV